MKWLAFLLPNREAPVSSSWDNSCGAYVANFRTELDDIAKKLSQNGQVVRTRLNSGKRCAEFHTAKDEIIVRVKVISECGVPSDVLINHGPSFQESWKQEFAGLLPGHVHFLSHADFDKKDFCPQ